MILGNMSAMSAIFRIDFALLKFRAARIVVSKDINVFDLQNIFVAEKF